jgi:peptidoglycan/LPS O-acetylase OafA/YrhL
MSATHNLAPVASRAASFRADIQGLRALAIVLVIGLHMNLAGFNAGFIGVDMFLVISGYVITLSLQKQPAKQVFRNLAKFWRGRFIRIFPAAALVICVTVIAAFIFQGLAFNSDLFTDARWATLYGTNLRLISSGSNYFIAGLDQSLLTHYWSLAVEQQFYLVFPVVVFGLTWLGKETNRKWILRSFLLVAIVASAYCSVIETSTNSISAYFSPLTRFWELAVGGLVATFTATGSKYFSFIGLALLGFSIYYLSSQSPYPGYLAWLPVMATALLLWAPLKPLGMPPLRYIGDISYSLYLWHFLWLVLPTQIENPITEGYWIYVFLIGAIVSAVISYHFFERPIHSSLRLKTDGYSALMVGSLCLITTWLVIAIIENLYLQSIL